MFHNKKITLFLLLTILGSSVIASQLDLSLKNAQVPADTKLPEDSTPPPPLTTPSTSTTSSSSTTTTTTTTTTPKPTTTTPKPAPYPKPSIGTWNSSCIMIRMAAQLNFTYETQDNKMATALYNIPSDAKVHDSECIFNATEAIELIWGPNNSVHSLTLRFDLKNGTSQLSSIYISLTLLADDFPNAKANQTIQLVHSKPEFIIPEKMSYHCTRAQFMNLTETLDEQKDIIGNIMLSDVQMEAFLSNGTTNFSTARDCDSSETSDVVPIAVGLALAALILVVLTAYLCARRRSSAQGYVSF